MGRLYWQNGLRVRHYGMVVSPKKRRHHTFGSAVRARRKGEGVACFCTCGRENEITPTPRRLLFWRSHPMVLHWACPDCGAWEVSKTEEDIE